MHMVKPYQPVPAFYRERLTIAIMCDESMDLHWRDEHSNTAYVAKVWPEELVEQAGMDYLRVRNEAGETLTIRLDLIENMPTPVK